MQVRAIATDLDGTLLRSDGTVSERTRRVVHAAEDAGLTFVIATGRPPRWIAPIVEALGERGLVVCANGASVYDPASHELVERTDLDPAVVGDLIDELQSEFPDAIFSLEQGFEFAIDERIREVAPQRLAAMPDAKVGPIRSFLDRPATKLMCRLKPPDDPLRPAQDRAQAVVGGRGLVTHSIDSTFLEISHPSVHKAATVERLLEGAGIAAAEVAAFGDMPNDIELIRWAGLGVAVANAHPDVRSVADEVTATNDQDGVAAVIERLLGSR